MTLAATGVARRIAAWIVPGSPPERGAVSTSDSDGRVRPQAQSTLPRESRVELGGAVALPDAYVCTVKGAGWCGQLAGQIAGSGLWGAAHTAH